MPDSPAPDAMRLIDLGRSDDMAHPTIRLHGIVNFCSSLAKSYPESARAWWQSQDVAWDARRGSTGEDDTWRTLQVFAGEHEKVCEELYRMLCKLTEAMRLSGMSDALVAYTFLTLYPSRLHRDRATDWEAFVKELRRVQLDARRLLDLPEPVLASAGGAVPFGSTPSDELRAAAERQATELSSHSSDFTTVHWFGTDHIFNGGQQAKAVGRLWKEWEAGGHGISEKTIGEEIGSAGNNYRLAMTFRNHRALGTMIVKLAAGIYALKKPE